MSGIAAASGSFRERVVASMLTTLRHRGRNGNPLCSGPEYTLGAVGPKENTIFCDGPTDGSTGRLASIADSALYNADRLRGELAEWELSTSGDAELLARVYQERGADCLRRIDGVFAFVLDDNGKLFAARDPLGVKPLYFGFHEDCLCFASELKAMPKECAEVKYFPPGHYFDSESGLVRYFDLQPGVWARDTPDEIASHLKSILCAAVCKRLPADRNIGVLLSGGLDSSTVCAIAVKYASSVHTFSSGTDHSEDLPFARALADQWGTIHHERTYTLEEIRDVLPEIIYHLESFDYLLVRSSIANHFASEMASNHVSVSLCGEGADELFAGYEYLKSGFSDQTLDAALIDMIVDCHATGLRRVDRMNMASGVEARMPYLDLELLRFAFTVPACYKIHGEDKMEKWIVRKAFEDDLPRDIVWRKKQKFSVGAGSYGMMAQYADSSITDGEFDRGHILPNGEELRNKEELYYYYVFRDCFGDAADVLDTVSLTASQ